MESTKAGGRGLGTLTMLTMLAVLAGMAACSSGGAGALFDDAGAGAKPGAVDSNGNGETEDATADSDGGAGRDAGKDAGKRDAGSSDSGSSDSGSSPIDGGAKTDSGTKTDGGGPPATATGLQGFCEHYFACGGTSYASVQACVTDAVDYWTVCRRPELDAFGTCMMQVSCQNWNPAAYDPYATPCGTLWAAMVNKSCP